MVAYSTGSTALTSAEEIELKLQLDPSDIAILLADPVFSANAPTMRDQVSTYYDTDTCTLRAAGLSLRIRKSGDQRVQTIKTGSKAAASLFARGEWECPVSGDTPELGNAPAIFAETLGAQAQQLTPAFAVEINRTTVVHDSGRGRIELVADQGRAVVAGRETAIAEIELELVNGNRAALFELAHRLSSLVPLRLGVQTKSERGYDLRAGKQRLSIKAEPITLARDSDTTTLFEAVAASCIRQFRLNEDRLLATGAPAALHQARVALRRLRSALSTFAAMLEGSERDRFQAEFRTLASALGRVRDVDVIIGKIDHEPTLAQLRLARTERYDRAVEMLNSDATRSLMLDFVEWLSIGHWRQRDETAELRATPALVTAAGMLDRLRRQMKRRGKHLATLADHDRHRVRIVGKKLRYTAEFFADLYRSGKAVRRRDRFLVAIEELQTALGHLNDLASGRALLAELGIANADAILASGKHADTRRLLTQAEQAHDDLIEVKRFWR